MPLSTQATGTATDRPGLADAHGADGAGAGADGAGAGAEPPGRPRARAVIRGCADLGSGLLLLAGLLAPHELADLTPATFLRIPLEGLLGLAFLIALPRRTARVFGALAGVLLGLIMLGDALDMGFYAVLRRPFDPVLDWPLARDAFGFLTSSTGTTAAIASAVGATALALAVLAGTIGSVMRIRRLALGHRTGATTAIAVLAGLWLAGSVMDLQTAPGTPFAATTAAESLGSRVQQLAGDLADRRAFAAEARVDAFGSVPGHRLLTGLRGKDVMVAFVESYGRSAVQDPSMAPGVDAVLDDGTRRLRAAGFAARSGFLTSPTFGGGSWLAHSTLLSGLWIDNQQRYRTLVASDRLTLNGAFHRAGWQTIGVMPGVTEAWPEGSFYGFDRMYDAHAMGYHGPHFSWAPMPDQYALAAHQRTELALPRHAPVMTEIPLVSSHAPWAPIPSLVGWQDVGDGSIFDPMPAAGDRPDDVWRDPAHIRTAYRESIQYTLNTLISYLLTYGNDRTVLVFLGDHQPATVVTGPNASHDVPVTIVARDPAVLDRVAGWHWQDGLRPGPDAPVWRMDEFRDRFLTAFS
ncbi:MAG TPA: hypothetical protein VI248_20995 [Kineosporiaceae bacterium]